VNTPGVAPGSPTTSEGDAAAVVDGAGTYHHGVYTCCGAGQGVSCCTADAGLLGFAADGAVFGDRAGHNEANCFQYGGSAGVCYGDNAMFDAKDTCAVCCAGLAPVSQLAVSDGGAVPACVLVGAPSAFACVPCGNGTCDPDENHCTCPADCP
jgi:hypothetical protein